jgi:hypothetical protein
LIIKEHLVERLQGQGIPLNPANAYAFGIELRAIFAAKVSSPDGKDDLALYKFTIWDTPREEEFTYDGNVNDAMDLFFKIGKHALQRMKIRWSNLSTRLLAQLLTFPFRYIPDVNKGIGKSYNPYRLTIAEGCKPFSAYEYFYKTHEKHQKDPNHQLDFIPELIDTAVKEVGITNIMKFMKVQSLDELKRKFLFRSN